MPRPTRSIPLSRLAGFLGVLGFLAIGCVDHNPSAPLYVFDAGSGTVQEWDDVNKVFEASGGVSEAANRIITPASISGTLGWGGMALDESADQIFLVFQDGTGMVIRKASDQSGGISGTDNVRAFTLDPSGSSLGTTVFGQATVDPSTHTLYVMETTTDGSKCRVWYYPNANTLLDGATLTTGNTFSVTGDKYGSGLAASSNGRIYGLFGFGSTVSTVTSNYAGTRLRMGQGNAFNGGASSQVLVGPTTALGSGATNYGSLAYDAQKGLLYAFVAPTTLQPQVLVFTASQFSSGAPDQAPSRVLGDSSTALTNLRILAHPASADWLAGADYTATTTGGYDGTGLGFLRLWKDPSGGGAATQVTMTGTSQIRGIALASGN